jgi:ectoine hydroxylase-related dioxygenase (phytanoyl-CoA dioxygenase family)
MTAPAPVLAAQLDDAPPPPIDESAWLELDPERAAAVAAELPQGARFALGAAITPVQRAYLDQNGYVVYHQVATPAEAEALKAEILQVQARLLAEGRTAVNGIPVWFGKDPDGKPFLQRLAFTSLFSDLIAAFVRDPRFEPVRMLVGPEARLGDREKDGVVLNRYIRNPGSLRPGLAWHTDGLRDVFYNWRMPGPQLNVGLHFERIRPRDGGLRIIPGSHRQGLWSLLFRKWYFVSHAPDPDEVAVETWPGDLTVHDGRTWHRVQASELEGWPSLRHSMYVPYLTDAYQPKDEDTPMMLYMRVFDLAIRLRKRLTRA